MCKRQSVVDEQHYLTLLGRVVKVADLKNTTTDTSVCFFVPPCELRHVSFLRHCLSDMPDKSCPSGSAACLITSEGSFSMGSPSSQLELLSSERYHQHYSSTLFHFSSFNQINQSNVICIASYNSQCTKFKVQSKT